MEVIFNRPAVLALRINSEHGLVATGYEGSWFFDSCGHPIAYKDGLLVAARLHHIAFMEYLWREGKSLEITIRQAITCPHWYREGTDIFCLKEGKYYLLTQELCNSMITVWEEENSDSEDIVMPFKLNVD